MSYLISFILLVVAAIGIGLCSWAVNTFNVGLNAIVNTLLSPMGGTSSTTILPAVYSCLPWVIGVTLLTVGVFFFGRKQKSKERSRRVALLFCSFSLLFFAAGLLYIQKSYDVLGYFLSRRATRQENVLMERYVDPLKVSIKKEGAKRNLIYIYLESMENTYADFGSGGRQKENLMPRLTELAAGEISFSPTEKLGGFQATDGAGWTMGALFTTTAGVPFEFPAGSQGMNRQGQIAPGIYTLGDFLEDEGYKQVFLCGSQGSFAGRKEYFEQHGNHIVYDYDMAVRNGDIPKGYHVWWGFEDAKLFEIAKRQLTELAAGEQPFHFTMLTVDAHHIGGYVCQECPDKYAYPTANVIACTDKQVADFVEWLRGQDFYENTTIVITGDHPRMDNCLVGGVLYEDRLVYNCFLNVEQGLGEFDTQRQFSGMDLFPTTLAALGYEIDENRLGLGVNLFSDEPTLLEELGIEAVNEGLIKASGYYVEHWMKDEVK